MYYNSSSALIGGTADRIVDDASSIFVSHTLLYHMVVTVVCLNVVARKIFVCLHV